MRAGTGAQIAIFAKRMTDDRWQRVRRLFEAAVERPSAERSAFVLTAVAGYLGLAAGVGLVELAVRFLPPSDFFRNPEVDMRIALMATGLLVACGTLAGFFPAWRAARVNPIQALRDE